MQKIRHAVRAVRHGRNPIRRSDAGPSGSGVGSLFPLIGNQAAKLDFPLSYLRSEFVDVAPWKLQARSKVLDLLHYSPQPCDPNPEIVERVPGNGYVREKVYFNTTPETRVPAYLFVPQNVPLPAPAIVALHDHSALYFWGKEKIVQLADEHAALTRFRNETYAGRPIAQELARRGYVVIVIDMFYWGERRLLFDDDRSDWRTRASISPRRLAEFNSRAKQKEELIARTIYLAGFTWSGIVFWDDLRTVDYLLTRPEVDKDRIGCIGLSLGGLRSCYLAALDDRIRAAVVVGWMTSFPAQLHAHVLQAVGFTQLVPGLCRYLDYPDVAALAMPAALLVINGSRDYLFEPAGVQAAFDKLAACFRKAGIPEKFRARLYDAQHEFNAEMQADAWQWLGKWL